MAGEWLIKQMNQRGGHINDYADVVYGTVISPKPLKIQLSEKITLNDSFLILGKNVVDHEEKIKIENKSMNLTFDGKTGNATINKFEDKVMIKQALKADDKVAMFRLDGGQQFYVFEKLSDEALKDENS
ncbi:DUF2577 domain-containing protein [Apilactobacillus timberlakei]|uniref:DUF2577 domain-containing protein n=1 Tax=Apilactobacillus timberlakei TaxID=2008380 RepID=UPI00112E48B8|nr:DUF2577 domain-containing protein [Apilactobacillus timberlakei]TPR21454.1 DUF2577 domain-containing protein [Apilactobacillus timberlakei]